MSQVQHGGPDGYATTYVMILMYRKNKTMFIFKLFSKYFNLET